MLDLQSNRWSELMHAYGPASDAPDLIRAALEDADEAWNNLFGALTHQGDASSSAYAAVPHVVKDAVANHEQPCVLHWTFVALVARHGEPQDIPIDIEEWYAEAVSRSQDGNLGGANTRRHPANRTYLPLAAAAAVFGYRGPAWMLEGLASEEFWICRVH